MRFFLFPGGGCFYGKQYRDFELLHGNISKVIVLITAASLTVVEIILVGGKWVPIPLLPFACLAGAGVAAGEYGYWRFCKGDFYDTDS